MQKLTEKQESFCRAIAMGKKWVDAYKESFETSNMKPNTIYRKANELKHHQKVAARITQLQLGECEDEYYTWTRQEAILTLKEILSGAKHKGDFNGAIHAIKQLNAMHGFNAPIKLDHTNSDGSISGAITLTNEQLAEELKKRNLPTEFLDE